MKKQMTPTIRTNRKRIRTTSTTIPPSRKATIRPPRASLQGQMRGCPVPTFLITELYKK
jgi:hypothetical protein